MKFPIFAAVAVSLGIGTGQALADTTSSDQDRATMEQKASPSNPTKQDEEQAEAHGQPDSPASGASATEKPTHGDYYRSQENNADSSAKPDASRKTDANGELPPGEATLPRSVR